MSQEACIGEMRNVYNILVGNPEGKRPLGRPRFRCEDIRMDLKQVGLEGVDWIHVPQDTDQWRVLVKTVLSLRVL